MDLSTRLLGLARRTVASTARALPEAAVRRALVAASHAGRGLPIGPPASKRCLVIAPHPDDESLAVGGLVHRLTSTGTHVELVLVTAGEASRAGGTPADLGRARVQEARTAAHLLGIAAVHELGLPDGSVGDHLDELTSALRQHLEDLRPDLVATTWWGDGHRDHHGVNVALGRLADRHGELAVWGGEMWTPVPATNLVDLRPEDVAAKAAAVAAHRTAARAFDVTARLALDRYRSVNGLNGLGHAEAYVVTPLGALPRLLDDLG